MHLRTSLLAAAAALAFAAAGAAQAADTLTVNGTPGDTWHYGTGNDYTPANTLVLATDAGDELDLRFHQTYVDAPASDGAGIYHFALGTTPLSFDWGIDTSGSGGFAGVTALLTLSRVGGGSVSYNPLAAGNDNSNASGSAQNSYRLNWVPIGFDANANSTYKVQLTVNGLTGGTKTLTATAQLGSGAAVPEATSWALLIAGFGGAGAMLRKRRASVATA